MRKSVAAFENVTLDAGAAYRWSTLCFFGGMLIIVVLDKVGGWVCGWDWAWGGGSRRQPAARLRRKPAPPA